MTDLESHLRGVLTRRKILAPYLMCGLPTPELFPELVAGIVDAGADLLEIGVPFSDPLMDGPVIQRAADMALRADVRPPAVFRAMSSLAPGVPFVLMTYVNPVLAMGAGSFAGATAECGASGVIVPDLPPEEADEWSRVAKDRGLAPVFLAAPTTPASRLDRIVGLGAGFVYCVSLLGVTGVRTSLSDRAREVVTRVRAATDRPALVGLGVSTPGQAAEVASFADGVIVGSAILKAVEDTGVSSAVELVRRMREALDQQPGAREP